MRLVSYETPQGASWGAVVEGGVVDLGRRLGPGLPDLLSAIRAGALDEARRAIAGAAPDHALSDLALLPPVTAPQKILCVGVNYPDRNAEYKDGSDAPKHPSLFFRAPTSLVGHDRPIERPRASAQLDYEGEVVLVIGKGGRHIPAGSALEHVVGATLCNEGSVRDWMRHGKFNVTQGKNFDRTGSLGPWLVTADEVDLRAPIRLVTRVNGEVRQEDTTDRMIFGFAFLVSYVSTFCTLVPGDVIVTGTPTGAGARFDPPRWLVPGDVVEVEATGLGVLRNRVVDEA